MDSPPTVYFIDDSATMREVIKIAFRRENINVVASHDADIALEEIGRTKPDVVITDVIMPGKDGYEVCMYIKNQPELAKIPVILMSGVVNRAVAEKAFAVKADELLRKPFQPQDLIARVKNLLYPGSAPVPSKVAADNAAAALSSIFSSQPPAVTRQPAPFPRPAAPGPVPISAVAVQPSIANEAAQELAVTAAFPFIAPTPTSAPTAVPASSLQGSPALSPRHGNGGDSKLRVEIQRLEGLIKKLRSELQAERDYASALESHIKTLQGEDR
jgi:CheY-like chemotaxis protein